MKQIVSLFFLLLFSAKISFSQILTDTNLPIVIITTDGGAEIPDDPKIPAGMKVIFRGAGLRNYVTDADSAKYLNYNGKIAIEIRGSSSQALPKKQYGLTTVKADNTSNNNVSLLGLPVENDWILNGLAFDPSLIRDYITYNLSRMMGNYATRTVYCEVIINGSYLGLYILEEKIKAGTDRVDVIKIGSGDNTYPKLTGGYITKSDKTTGGDPIAWTMSSYIGTNDVAFIHELPKPASVSTEQNNYIMSEFNRLYSSATQGNNSFYNGYPSVIDVPSFVDYMIINELSANTDAYQYSTFYHKDRDGKLRAGPIWDCNLTYGNDLFMWGFDRSKTDTWQFSNGDNEGPKYWKALFNNPEFRCYMSKRWNDLTKTGSPLNLSSITTFIDQAVSTISEAAAREESTWGTVGNLAYEVTKIKVFLQQRIPWITAHLGSSSGCSSISTPPLVITRIMYNPEATVDFPVANDLEFVEITNTGNKITDLTGFYFSGTGFVYQFPPDSKIIPGCSKIIASNSAVFSTKYGFSPSGQFTRNLSNTGQKLVLADGFGNVVDEVSYSILSPWPNANGNGKFLELIDPLSDNNTGSNWMAITGTVESENEKVYDNIRVYPSVVKDDFVIEWSENAYILQIYDTRGSLLKTTNVDSGYFTVSISPYPAGTYLIRLISPKLTVVRKIIKE
jgi:hypothetical protein